MLETLNKFVFLPLQGVRSKRTKTTGTSRVPELKVLILVTYFAVLIAFGATLFIMVIHLPSIPDYFLCESTGTRPGKHCNKLSESDNISIVVISTIFLALLQLYPGVNLIYAVNAKEVKKIYAYIFSKTATCT